jgi:L-seryl-tRNA(Ser) seleniumtransferase
MDLLLATPECEPLRARFGHEALKRALGAALEEARKAWRGGAPAPTAQSAVSRAAVLLEGSFRPLLRPVINATGVILHTNLGRAPLPAGALRDASRVLSRYVDLEVDLATRTRGHRDARIEGAFQEFLGTDYGVVVVNNNAAATLLMLNTLSAGRETLVSRGELVEIGGGFRVPEVLAASGAVLKEVGTTNRTRISDYRKAAGPQTGLLLKVHPSNYRIVGFTEEAPLRELVDLGSELRVPVAMDLGTGLLAEGEELGLEGESTVAQVLADGPDAFCFSADKLLGGSQAGVLMVAPRHVEAFRSNPLLRALRADKLAYFLLGEVLRAYRTGRRRELPALALLAAPAAGLRRRAVSLKRTVSQLAPGRFHMEVVEAQGRAGGGTAPTSPLRSPALALRPAAGSCRALDDFLRSGDPPVLGVMEKDRLLLHMRTLLPGDHLPLAQRIASFPEE